ncbi:MAG TPA: hypothetical protein PKD85_07620 [Saprospiraceae bacterium]|nr:hypothetical protein [Saprospiraceae bacterium]
MYINDIIYPKIETIYNDSSGRNTWEEIKQAHSSRGGQISPYSTLICDVICTNYTSNHCDQIYILKFIPFEAYRVSEARDIINNEIKLQKDSSRIGVSPPIVDSWFSDVGGVIIMEKLEIDVETLLTKYKSLEVIHLIFANITNVIDKLHLNGIYHGDLHLQNIMAISTGDTKYDEKDENELVLFTKKGYRFYLIDFGEGGYLKYHPKLIKGDYEALQDHFVDILKPFISL